MKVIRDLKKDGLTAEHSEALTGPVPLSAARLGSKHIFTHNPFFVRFFFFLGFDLKLQIVLNMPPLEG